jgi:hypothetical protein
MNFFDYRDGILHAEGIALPLSPMRSVRPFTSILQVCFGMPPMPLPQPYANCLPPGSRSRSVKPQ